MNTYSFNADFITTKFENYVDITKPAWGNRKKRLYQHTDLPEWKGLSMFAKDFVLSSMDNTYITFSSLGAVNIYVNGHKIDIGEMMPGWTDYNKRSFYIKTDITEFINDGKNRILAVVAPGWYCGRISGGIYGVNSPAFACEISQDNLSIKTDGTWFTSIGGQIRTADIWDGEYRNGSYDDYTVISDINYNLDSWKNSEIFDYKGKITEYIGPEINIRENLTLYPQNINISDKSVSNGKKYGKLHYVSQNSKLPIFLKAGNKLIADFGQESVGWVKATIKAKKDTIVKFRYAEFLNDTGSKKRGNDGPEGSVYTINLRSALAKAYYKFGSDTTVTYRPTFTFFGYRYVEITADNDIELLGLSAEILGSDTKEIGCISTSNTLVNKLISNTLWGQRSNYLSVPTDCPQRDERLGWTGDAQAFSTTAAYNADVYSFFRKWLQDMRDSQADDGGYGDVNPRVACCTSQDAAAWADAGIIIPWNMYKMYGDKTILKEHYDSMVKYINGLVEKFDYTGPVPRYGDWLAYDLCDNKFISSAYFVHDCDLMVNISNVLGYEEKVTCFENMRNKAFKYFSDNFLKDDKPKGKTQCDKIICLAFDLLKENIAYEIAKELAEQIKENGNRLSCGFLGTYNLCPALSKYGQSKTAYNLLLQRNEPSWLYSIDQGATTIWERWNSYTHAKGFGDVGMNSFNHYAYGSIVEWMYYYMAGIQPLEAGFNKIRLAPEIDLRNKNELPEGQTNITWVKASYNSEAGLITSEWNNENEFIYKCKVPADTVLYLPVISADMKLNDETIKPEIKNGKAIINLTAGEYIITA